MGIAAKHATAPGQRFVTRQVDAAVGAAEHRLRRRRRFGAGPARRTRWARGTGTPYAALQQPEQHQHGKNQQHELHASFIRRC